MECQLADISFIKLKILYSTIFSNYLSQRFLTKCLSTLYMIEQNEKIKLF